MEKYILITAVVIMIIILALDFILSKDGYQCHSCKKRFHKEDLERGFRNQGMAFKRMGPSPL